MDVAGEVALYVTKSVLKVFGYSVVLASFVAVYQEHKIWKPSAVPSLNAVGALRVFLFNVTWMSGSGIGAVLICLKWMLTFGRSDIARDGNCLVERYVAQYGTNLVFGRVKVKGLENIPKDIERSRPAPIFVANHASQLDVASVYFLNQRWKWIAKRSVLLLPGAGLNMWLSDYIFINRRKGTNKESVSNLFDQSDRAVQRGIPLFFFPQGTRRFAEKLPFKKGAFVVAQKNKSPLIPISIEIPINHWNSSYPFNYVLGRAPPTVTITVHRPIKVSGTENVEALMNRTRDQIYSVLPDISSVQSKIE